MYGEPPGLASAAKSALKGVTGTAPEPGKHGVAVFERRDMKATPAAVRVGTAVPRVQREHRDRRLQLPRLVRHRRRGGRRLLHQRGILLGDLVHLRHGAVHLFDARALFVRCSRDFAHDVGHALHCLGDFGHRLTGPFGKCRTAADARRRGLDQFLDLFGRQRAALRERTHFARDHCEAAALLTGARRFHRGVQRENVGLERDPFDHRDDVGHALRAGRQLAHRLDHIADQAAAARRHFRRAMRDTARLLGVLGIHLHRRGQFLHARRGFLQRGSLFFSTLRQIGVALRDLARCHQDRFARLADARYDARQPLAHVAQREQHAVGIARTGLDAHAQVAIGNPVGDMHRVVRFAAELTREAPRNHRREQRAYRDRAQHQREHHNAHVLIIRARLLLGFVGLLTAIVDQRRDAIAQRLARRNRAAHEFVVVDAGRNRFETDLLMHDALPHCRLAQHGVEHLLTLAGFNRRAILVVGAVHLLERGDDAVLQLLTAGVVGGVAEIRGGKIGIDLVAVRLFHPVEAVHVPVADGVGNVMHRRQRLQRSSADDDAEPDHNGKRQQQLPEYGHAVEPLHLTILQKS